MQKKIELFLKEHIPEKYQREHKDDVENLIECLLSAFEWTVLGWSDFEKLSMLYHCSQGTAEACLSVLKKEQKTTKSQKKQVSHE